KYGLNFAKQAGAGVIPSGGTGGISTSPTQSTYRQLTSIGPESYLFTLPASVLIDFFKQDSDAKTLASPKLRVLNNKSASINIGDKQPILLSTTNVLPGQAATGAVPTTSTVTSIEFKDTGVKFTVEPSINLMDEVTLKLKVEVTNLGDQVTLQASPEIKQFRFGTRVAETVLSLKDDETVVLAGLIQDVERKTRSTVPLLGDIPLLGHLFSSVTKDRVETEVVLTLTPRVVRTMAAPPMATQAMWSGTENAYATTQLYPPRALKVSQERSPASTSHMKPSPDEKELASGAVPQSANRASMPAIAPTSSATTFAEPVARGPSLLTLRPADLSAAAGQEFRLDLMAARGDAAAEATATVSYDPTLVEFRRVGPGAAAISARAADGQVVLTIRRPGRAETGEAVLAMLFFQAKAKGEARVTLQVNAGGTATAAGPIAPEQAVVHVR
ncbi:MAG: hypothetical protein NTX84_07775, partial [Nitrospirae bacterium]|nr:hypothetical protein [Nitrospirota bacterium]